MALYDVAIAPYRTGEWRTGDHVDFSFKVVQGCKRV
jgi:hypothetical protein